MSHFIRMSVWISVLAVSAAFWTPCRCMAQDAPVFEEARVNEELALPKSLRADNIGVIAETEPAPALWQDLAPEFSPATLTWIAVVVILVLMLQTKPILSWHNLDALMLALTALIFPLRDNLGPLVDNPTGHTVQWWSYLLLCVAASYWLIRGLRLLLLRNAPGRTANASEGAMFVLIVAGLCLAGFRIAAAPISEAARDGLIGGVCFADTGKLPYGDAAGHDARSPLLYLVHAGAVKIVEPVCEPEPQMLVMRWDNREKWMSEDARDTIDPAPARLVNAALFILLFAAAAGIGHRLHSVALGQTLGAILCIFPGALECFTQPDIMLPAVLLAWSILFVTLPGIGGFLSVIALVFGGLAWPWAWLALPLLLAYLLRQGWQGFGATLGLLGSVAAIIVGVAAWTSPTLPREDGALREAGFTPSYAARLSGDGALVIDRYQPDETTQPDFKKWLWKPLLSRDNLVLDTTSILPAYPNGVDGASIYYRDVTASGGARTALQLEYRTAVHQAPRGIRTLAAVRSVLETTWKPETAPAQARTGVWRLWQETRQGVNWSLARRCGKIAVAVLALFAAFMLIRGERGQIHQLLGGMLAVCAGSLLISFSGAATNWAWLAPAMLACLAAKSPSPGVSALTPSIGDLPPIEEPAPRITVEN